jgi:Rrf2 family protein
LKISAKSRYALAVTIYIGKLRTDENVTVIQISEKLGISKIYLEQVFSLLRHAGIVLSEKGAQGGYRLALPPGKISVLDILSSIETSLFSGADSTVKENAPDIENALQSKVFTSLDSAVANALSGVMLEDLIHEAERYGSDGFMYYL